MSIRATVGAYVQFSRAQSLVQSGIRKGHTGIIEDYAGAYRDHVRIMENKMESTILFGVIHDLRAFHKGCLSGFRL